MAERASSYATHRHSVIPSACCGFVVACVVSIRKKWQTLWMSCPRNRKYQSMVSIRPRSARSSMPVSSRTSRIAASSARSPDSRCPFGKPQF
jgi:hypothetical protein